MIMRCCELDKINKSLNKEDTSITNLLTPKHFRPEYTTNPIFKQYPVTCGEELIFEQGAHVGSGCGVGPQQALDEELGCGGDSR